jgi:hypothetical protein
MTEAYIPTGESKAFRGDASRTTEQEIITLQMASEANRQTAKMIELLCRFKAEFDELQESHQLLVKMIYRNINAAKRTKPQIAEVF